MIFTSTIPNLGTPEEQSSNGHGLTFTNGVFNLAATNTSPPPGMNGFRAANLNPACPFAFFLDLQFSATPTLWQIQAFGSALFSKATTWRNQETGNLSGTTFTVQHPAGSMAVENDHLRLLIPQIAGNISSIRITLGPNEQSHLVSANFHRVFAAIHPTPALSNAELTPNKRTKTSIRGRSMVVLQDPDPVFSCRLLLDAHDSDRELLDLNELAVMRGFAMWPSGLETTFTRNQPVIYRRPDFARNMAVSRSSGLRGTGGLDYEGGPTGIALAFVEDS